MLEHNQFFPVCNAGNPPVPDIILPTAERSGLAVDAYDLEYVILGFK